MLPSVQRTTQPSTPSVGVSSLRQHSTSTLQQLGPPASSLPADSRLIREQLAKAAAKPIGELTAAMAKPLGAPKEVVPKPVGVALAAAIDKPVGELTVATVKPIGKPFAVTAKPVGALLGAVAARPVGGVYDHALGVHPALG